MAGRAKAAREARRTAMFHKFRLTELNLVPLVDTFVSIVFFSLTTQTLGEMAPTVNGVSLPQSRVGAPSATSITLGIASKPAEMTLSGHRIMTVQAAAQSASNVPNEPLIIPTLYTALHITADSIRKANDVPADQSVEPTLAVQADKGMRYDLLARVLQTARKAGFKNVSLQVLKTGTDAAPQRAS
ncbi:MAG: biopolymer transporter ExbD [Gemmatimonadaceae bacterium]